MPFSVADRKSITKKMLDIPDENQSSANAIVSLQANIDKLKDQDKAVKDNFFDPSNSLVTSYHAEFALVNGEQRTNILESQVVDSAKRILGNAFFPNDVNVAIAGPPALPDGIWKEFKAFAGNFAKGRTQTGAAGPTVQIEQDLIDLINTTITSIEANPDVNRTTGQECGESATSGSCAGEDSPPQTTQATCEADNGTWTGDDEIRPDPTVQSLIATLKTQIQDWEDFLNTEAATIVSPGVDLDTTRNSQNITAGADITSTISDIDTWQALSDFDTSHGLTTPPNTCAQFDAINIGTLGPTKLKPANLDTLKTSITDREAFLITRDSQLDTNLGDITQDTDGSISAQSGLYGDRYTALDLRINLIGGFLTGQFGRELGQRAQTENIDNNNAALVLFTASLKISKFISAGNETTIIHVEDNTEFNALDNIFIVSDNQVELTGQVVSKSGDNQVTLDIQISNRYNDVDNSRIVKDLT